MSSRDAQNISSYIALFPTTCGLRIPVRYPWLLFLRYACKAGIKGLYPYFQKKTQGEFIQNSGYKTTARSPTFIESFLSRTQVKSSYAQISTAPARSQIRSGCLHSFFDLHSSTLTPHYPFCKTWLPFFDHCFRVIQSEKGCFFLSKTRRASQKIIRGSRLALSHGVIRPCSVS